MSNPNNSKPWQVWMRRLCLAGMVVAGFYFVFDPATPKLYKLWIALGALGFILYFSLGGGGGKGGPMGGYVPPTRSPH